MAPQQMHKTAVVALFLAALVLVSPAAAYRPQAAGYTPAEATPTEAAVSTPTEANTPAKPVAEGYTPGASASTPAEATPADAAVSTPTEASTPAKAGYTPGAAVSTPTTEASTPADAGTPVAAGYTPAAAAGTTPAAESAKATTDAQKLMEIVNGVYKKALEAANAAAPVDKYKVFEAAFVKGINECPAGRNEVDRSGFAQFAKMAIHVAYVSTSYLSNITDASAEERFSNFVFPLTEALRMMAAAVEAHTVKPASEEALKAPASDQQYMEKIDAAVKAAAAAAKDAPNSDKFLVFQATFNNAFKDEMGPGYDVKKAIPLLDVGYDMLYNATVGATPGDRFAAFRDALARYIIAMGRAAEQAGVATKPAAEVAAKPAAEAAYKPAAEAATEPAVDAAAKPAAETAYKPAAEAAAKPAAEASYKPAAQAAAKPAGGTVGGYNL